MRFIRFLIAVAVLFAQAFAGPTGAFRVMAAGSIAPPTHTNLPILGNAIVKPVWWSNDEFDDAYSGDFVFALSSLGMINLIGHDQTSSTSIDGYNGSLLTAYYNQEITDRANGFIALGNSGWNTTGAPAISGTYEGHLTVQTAVSSAATVSHPSKSAFIAAVHANATPQQPVIFACGGPLTLLAAAYLDDNTIADKVVVTFVSGDPAITATGWYNEWADSMAARVVFKYFKVVCFPTSLVSRSGGSTTNGSPNISMPATLLFPGMRITGTGIQNNSYIISTNGSTTATLNANCTATGTGTVTFSLYNTFAAVPKAWLTARLPDSPIRSIMFAKARTGNNLPDGIDGDAQALIILNTPGYATAVTRYSVTNDVNGGETFNSNQGAYSTRAVPKVTADAGGNLYVCAMDGGAATTAWWNVMTTSRLWTGGSDLVFTTVPGVDNFNRSNGGLGAGYGQFGAIARNTITSSRLEKAGSGYSYDYSTATYTADQYASMKMLGAPVASYYSCVGIRNAFYSGSDINGYQIYPNASSSTNLQRGANATYTNLLSGMPAMVVNDQWRLAVRGSQLSVWRNNGAESDGVLLNGWRLVGAVKDTAHSNGVPSILNSRSAGPTVFGDDADFGNVTSP